MSESSSRWDGVERRTTYRRGEDLAPIHPWRWRGLVLWIILFTALTFWAIRGLEHQSATVTELQRTNCGLEKFILQARVTRWQAYVEKQDVADLSAVVGYERLAAPFVHNHEATGNCPIPSRLVIKSRPLDGIR